VRVNRGAHTADVLVPQLRRLQAAEGDLQIYAPRPLSWYPHSLAWQWDDLCSWQIKKDARYKKLKAYLCWLQDHGALTRQEVVSMIPPLCLGIEPGDLVLDLCAAPGSKTSQLLEMMQWSRQEGGEEPTGCVLANEIDARRADTLTHNVQRLGSPSTLVTQIDGQYFPNMTENNGQSLQFDRVLADVPCSGDGTLRKSTCLWSKWTPRDAMGLHLRQYTLLCRGLDLLKVGGRLVYSTCSFNPIEDEAVVAAVLRRYGESITVVPLPTLDGLQGCPGLATWVVPHPDDATISWERFEDVPVELHARVRASSFPAAAGTRDAEAWEKCCSNCRRFLPHHVNSGGFFVAVLEKVSDPTSLRKISSARPYHCDGGNINVNAGGYINTKLETDLSEIVERVGADCAPCGTTETEQTSNTEQKAAIVSARALRRREAKAASFPVGEYIFLDAESETWKWISSFFGLPVCLAERFCFREQCDKKLYCVSSAVARVLKAKAPMRLRIPHAGVRVFERLGKCRADGGPPFWRLAQEGLPVLLQHGLRRHIAVSRTILKNLLSGAILSQAELRAAESSGEIQSLDSIRDPSGSDVLVSGSLALTLIPEHCRSSAPVVVAALLSGRCLEVFLPRGEAVAMLESLELEARTASILDGTTEVGDVEDDSRMDGAVDDFNCHDKGKTVALRGRGEDEFADDGTQPVSA